MGLIQFTIDIPAPASLGVPVPVSEATDAPQLADGFHLFRSGEGRLSMTSTATGTLSFAVVTAGDPAPSLAEIEAGTGLASGQEEIASSTSVKNAVDLSAHGLGSYDCYCVMRNNVGVSPVLGPIPVNVTSINANDLAPNLVVSVIGPLSPPREQDWWIWPNGNAGEARIEMPAAWYGAVPVDTVEYRFQVQDATADSYVLGDPTGAWSAWIDAGVTTGAAILTGLPVDPCCVQIRTVRGGNASLPSTHKRIGLRFFDYDDTIRVHPGCVAETVPATVRWGTLNIAGEGGQRVPDDTTAITAGDPSGHFAITETAGRKYLIPTGAAAWTGGETYALVLDDSGTTTVAVEIEADAAALMSYAYGNDPATVSEYAALIDRTADFSGVTLLLRPGAYFNPNGLSETSARNHQHLYNLTAPVRITSDDPSQPAVWSGWTVTDAGQDRQIVIEDVICHAPQFFWAEAPGFGGQSALEVWGIAADGGNSTFEIGRVLAFTDGIEARYGFHVRGNGIDKVELTTFALSGTGFHVHDCRSLYCYYPLKLEGMQGVVERGLVSHVEGDYFNPQPNTSGRSPIVRNMRFREHCGDQGNVHSDAFHIWQSGTHDGLIIEGNVWLTGYEGRACPGQIPAVFANQPLTITQDIVLTAADLGGKETGSPTRLLVGLTDIAGDLTVTLPDPSGMASGTYAAVCNYGTGAGSITITDGAALTFVASGAQEKALFTTSGGAWVYDPPNKSFQGLFNNNGTQSYVDTAWRFNIVQGLTAPTAAMINGTGVADQFYLHNNSLMTNLLTIADDIDGNGFIDDRDGDPGRNLPKIQLQKPGVTADFKNIVSDAFSSNRHADVWDDWYLGAASADSVAHREEVFANADGRGFRPPETFAQAIEAARPRADSPLAAARIGAVGPADDTPGFWNFTTGAFNGYPEIVPTHVYPEQDGVALLADSLRLWFEYSVQVLDPAGIVLRDVDSGAMLPLDVTVAGRLMTLTHSGLTDGRRHEVVVAPGAIAVWDDAKIGYGGHGGGAWRFTASAAAQPNVIFLPAGLGLYQGDSWIDPAVAGVSSIDTNNQAKAVIPAGPAQHQIEVAAGVGEAQASLTIYDGGSFSPAYALTAVVDTDTGSFTTVSLTGSDVAGAAVAAFAEPVPGGWRFVWQTDWSGRVTSGSKPPRYVLKWNTSNNPTSRWRRASLYQAHTDAAPWLPKRGVWNRNLA